MFLSSISSVALYLLNYAVARTLDCSSGSALIWLSTIAFSDALEFLYSSFSYCSNSFAMLEHSWDLPYIYMNGFSVKTLHTESNYLERTSIALLLSFAMGYELTPDCAMKMLSS